MFYPAVEEYVMHNRQRELAKELEIRRQLHNSLDSRPDYGLRFPTKAVDLLRNLASVFVAGAGESIDDVTTADCVVC